MLSFKFSNLQAESLKDSLFYEFKRYGKILNTFIRGQGSDRNAIIVFSKPEDVERVIKDYKVSLGF